MAILKLDTPLHTYLPTMTSPTTIRYKLITAAGWC